MPWVTDEKTDSKYWVPDVYPEPTIEYNEQQSKKSYLTPIGERRQHPGWYYENNALVDDEYLFRMEEWKLIIDPDLNLDLVNFDYKITTKPISEWIESPDGKSITITYEVYKYIIEPVPTGDRIKECYLNDPAKWIVDDNNFTITKTWNIIEYTDEEYNEVQKEKEQLLWNKLRAIRNKKLFDTDRFVMMAVEYSNTLTGEFREYRRLLRDFPETIQDINTFDFDDETLWPEPCTNYFIVPEN